MNARLGLLWLERRFIQSLDEEDRWDAWLRLRGFDAQADQLKTDADAKVEAAQSDARKRWAEQAGALSG